MSHSHPKITVCFARCFLSWHCLFLSQYLWPALSFLFALPPTSLSTTWQLLISRIPHYVLCFLITYTCSSAHPVWLKNPIHLSRSCKTSTTFLKSKQTIVHLLLQSFVKYILYLQTHPSSVTPCASLPYAPCTPWEKYLGLIQLCIQGSKNNTWPVVVLTKYFLN